MAFKIPDDVESWTDEELARAVIVRGRIHGSSQLNNPKLSEEELTKIFAKVFDKAAQDYGFASHAKLPAGVQTKIGLAGGRGRAFMTREIDNAGPPVYWEPKVEELSLFPEAKAEEKVELTPEQEEALARELIELVGASTKPFLRVFGRAAKQKGYSSYGALPKGTKRYISNVGVLALREKRQEKECNARQLPLPEIETTS